MDWDRNGDENDSSDNDNGDDDDDDDDDESDVDECGVRVKHRMRSQSCVRSCCHVRDEFRSWLVEFLSCH